MYGVDNDDELPSGESSGDAGAQIAPYLKRIEVLKTVNPNGGSIRYNVHLAHVNLTSIATPAQTVLWYDSEPWPDGTRVVAFADGHAKSVNPEEWMAVQATLIRRYPAADQPKPTPTGRAKPKPKKP
jgi:prepilin-type processing-associated H-X9-DG protein